MTVGAFLDAGLRLPVLKKRLKALGVSGYTVDAVPAQRGGIHGMKFAVIARSAQHGRCVTYNGIKRLMRDSRLNAGVRSRVLAVFATLAAAEARVHHVRVDKVRFHEIGDLDSIIDIVSAAIALDEFGVRNCYCLNLNAGRGLVTMDHGVFPLPAPASLEILKDTPLSFLDVEEELVTPTGAAILTTLVEDFNARPGIRISHIGYGAGARELRSHPNMLRVIIGDSREEPLPEDEVAVIETAIDDMSPACYDYVVEKLFKCGALDVYLTPVYMKKTRPAVLLTAVAPQHLADTVGHAIMEETTTSGVRFYRARRKKLYRYIKSVKTKFGTVRVKVNSGPGGIRTVSPEYEDCKAAALKTGSPLKDIIDEAKKNLGKGASKGAASSELI